MSALAARLTSLKAKSTELTVKEVKVPESSADPLTLFEANTAARTDSSNEWTIDVFPSQISVFMYLMMLANNTASLADHKVHAKSSSATFCLYYMAIYHAFFLINDLYVRPTPSAHAVPWNQSSYKANFAQFLLSLPVPAQMETVLAQLYATQTDRTANVFFVPTAAGFDHDVFFGRFIPLTFFAHIHDCIATMPGNSSRSAIMNDLLPRVLYRYNDTDVVFADVLGFTIDATVNTTTQYPNTKLHQVFSSVFNPVLFRDFHRRSSLATLDLSSPNITSVDSAYAYDILFGATPNNLRELKVILQAVSALITTTVPCKKTLSSLIAEGSGISILTHGYSDFALPTWSRNPESTHTHFGTMTRMVSLPVDRFAAKISFLARPARRPTTTTDVEDVTLTGADASVTARHWPWSLRSQNDSQHPCPSLDDFVAFDEYLTPNPLVLVLDVEGSKTITTHLATLTHKIIESYELDGTTIEMPRADKSLGLQNCMFADSAIPYKYVIPGSEFYPREAGSLPLPLKKARPVSQSRLPASSLLHDRTVLRLPRLLPRVIERVLPATLPGMTLADNFDWLRYIQSFLGFRTATPSQCTPSADSVPAMEEKRLYVFSPYSFTPVEDDDQEEVANPRLSQSRHYFLTNLRTLFGTDFNLVEAKHPFEALPVL
jgi:hypothetical protein